MRSWVIQCRRLIAICAFCWPCAGALCQSVFLTTVNGESRGYLVVQSRDGVVNQPLVIVLHAGGSSAEATFRNEAMWKSLQRPATIIFPMATDGRWRCDAGPGRDNDLLLIRQIISEAYDNYRIDRNRVFIIGEGDSYCLALAFKESSSELVAAVLQGRNTSRQHDTMISASDSLLRAEQRVGNRFDLWTQPIDPLRDFQREREDSIKRYSWNRRTSWVLGAGGFVMLGLVKTDVDDKTYMDIGDAHQQFQLTVTKWMNDSLSWFVNVSWLRIPRKQEVKITYQGTGMLVKGEGGGGAVVPITVGLKYAFYRHAFRPYVAFGTGPTSVMVLGGKFRSTSTNIDPAALQDDIAMEVRNVFHVMLGTGCEWRISKRMVITGDITYLHSGQFESAGQVNAVRGFSANTGIGYLMGVNRLR